MDRSIRQAPRIALAVSTALAGLALAGCTTSAAPKADMSFASAQNALGKGQVDKAIVHAEAAVLAEPRNPGYRALLGAAYLESGRFQSAATSFGDALDLGDENPRTVLSFALAKIALGEGRSASAVLDEYANLIDPADLGLALALAGEPERGVHVLVNAVRASDQVSPKLRQNLAYTYALAGNWRAARVMAAEDVPADQLDQRLTQWAAMSAPEQFRQRVASLLDVTPQMDAGQPQRLALANFPSDAMMFAEAATQAPAEMAAEAPTPALAAEPTLVATFAQAFESAPVARPASRISYVSNPVVQQLPTRAERAAPRSSPRMAAASSQRRMAATASDKNAGSHLVQLGSYSSKVEAERGWTVLKAKFPELKDHNPVITEAVVNGRNFWRVAAEGFGPKSAQSLCSSVKSAGRGCFAYSASSPPAGAVKRDVRMASRAR
ncbi:MAG: SPOR domain-containing protein [Alphaproteobacteria bacterium HGW-Alphaproteobacteria-7]|jgi:Flp pilus assembly protein TadD|nr:MAG: SPOR domain-containing protein [Alphaproteobacteria bacterium HGW-Alphaproteobacteria-7]